MPTKPEVFIIETLHLNDEADGLTEGEIICDVLRRSGKTCQYVYIRTRRELVVFLQRFTESNYRYLHISCHGNHDGVKTTLDDLTLTEFCEILRPHLAYRRLFVSACLLTQASLAKRLFNGSELYSILGPANKIPFSDAAAFWPSLYHALFKVDHGKINGATLLGTARALADIFDLKLNYYRSSKTAKHGFATSCIGRSVSFKQLFYAKNPRK
jgi:hypothetical protein